MAYEGTFGSAGFPCNRGRFRVRQFCLRTGRGHRSIERYRNGSSGGAVSGATIDLRNVATNTTSTATTNDSGYYVFASVTPGTYELKTSVSGFANYTQTGIVLTVGETATVNAALQLASQGERVVVTTEAQTIEPTKTEISQVVGTQQIQSLPINGRLFTDFALLTPASPPAAPAWEPLLPSMRRHKSPSAACAPSATKSPWTARILSMRPAASSAPRLLRNRCRNSA